MDVHWHNPSLVNISSFQVLMNRYANVTYARALIIENGIYFPHSPPQGCCHWQEDCPRRSAKANNLASPHLLTRLLCHNVSAFWRKKEILQCRTHHAAWKCTCSIINLLIKMANNVQCCYQGIGQDGAAFTIDSLLLDSDGPQRTYT